MIMGYRITGLPSEPFQLYCHKVVSIGALHLCGVSLPPGHPPSELEGLQVGEYFVIEKSTKPCWIMTAYLEALTNRVPGAALTLNICNRCHDFVT
jgi:hypothetical protein